MAMKILLVEDSAADAVLLEEQLSQTAAFEVDIKRCRNLDEAEQSTNDDDYDIVLLDMNLPDSKGLATVQSMQSACPNVPILVLSGEDNERSALAALNLGVEDYLLKGHVPVEQLAELIVNAVERHSVSGWDGKLQSIPVPENSAALERFTQRLRPLLAADSAASCRTVVFAARIERMLAAGAKTLDLDHSIFVISGVATSDDVDAVTQELTRTLSVPVVAGRDKIRASVELGIAVSPDDSQEPTELLAKALHALGDQQFEGTGKWKYFSQQLNRRSAHRQRLLHDVSEAVNDEKLQLQYQPIVDAKSRIAVRLEALLRWTRADGFVTSAATFMPFVEENGLVQRVDDFVINQVGRQLQTWQINGGDQLPVAINVSARSLISDTLCGVIGGMLDRFQIEPKLIELEITESSLIGDIRSAAQNLKILRALGVSLALDDFGCAYASLDYLRHLDVDRLKIDKAFTRDIDDRRTLAIVRSVVTMAHELDMCVTAEGVETEEQAAALVGLECDELQGFLFARPARPEQRRNKYLELAIID